MIIEPAAIEAYASFEEHKGALLRAAQHPVLLTVMRLGEEVSGGQTEGSDGWMHRR